MGKNKILLVSPGNSEFTDPWRKALVKLGYEVTLFDYRSSIYFSNKYIRKLYRIIPGAKQILKKNTSRRFLKKVKENSIDYVVALKAETILPEAIREAGKIGVITMNWYPEYIWNWSVIEKIAPAYDFFFSSDPYVLNKLKEEKGLSNCFYLAYAADIDENTPDPFENREEIYNVSMIASYSGFMFSNRLEYLIQIKDLGLNVWGSKEWAESPLKKCYRGRVIQGGVLDIYRKTKIVPNMHYNQYPATGTTLRPFEAMASGAMVISDDIRPDIFNIFKDGEEFVSFHEGDSQRFKELVEYYLSHPEERLRIARNGYRSILTKHTYSIRMKEMIELVNRNKV